MGLTKEMFMTKKGVTLVTTKKMGKEHQFPKISIDIYWEISPAKRSVLFPSAFDKADR